MFGLSTAALFLREPTDDRINKIYFRESE